MLILCGTKVDESVVAVAVFDTESQLATYVNALVVNPLVSSELDATRKAASVLADCVDQQTVLLDAIWDTWPNWQTVLLGLKSCPRNPVFTL